MKTVNAEYWKTIMKQQVIKKFWKDNQLDRELGLSMIKKIQWNSSNTWIEYK